MFSNNRASQTSLPTAIYQSLHVSYNPAYGFISEGLYYSNFTTMNCSAFQIYDTHSNLGQIRVMSGISVKEDYELI